MDPEQTGGASSGGEGGGEGSGEQARLESKASAEDQQKAREMGWIPPTEWRGAADKFTDADEFLRRGETFVPFLRAERRRLGEQLSARDLELEQLRAELQQTKESVGELVTFNREMAAERAKRRKTELNGLIHQATEAGDEAKAAEHRAELTEIVEKERKQPAGEERREEPVSRTATKIQPWVKTWLETDSTQAFLRQPHQADVFNGIVARKRAAGDKRVGDVQGTEFLNECLREAQSVFGGASGNSRREEPSRTEESRPSGGGGSGGAPRGRNTYAALPQEAKDLCDKQEKKFVGPGKLFKDQAAWRAHYASEYFGPSTAAVDRLTQR